MRATSSQTLLVMLLILSPPLAAEDLPAARLTAGDSRSEAATEFLAARLEAARGAFQAALDSYTRAHELAPDDPWPDLERGRLLLRLRDVGAAIRLAEEVILRAPELLEARELLAEARLVAAESDPRAVPAAEVALRDVLTRSGYDPAHAFDLARLLQTQGRVADAVDVLSTATAVRPDPRLQSVLVRLMLELGRENDAEVVLRELLGLAPGALEERLLLVEILSRREDHAAAAEVIAAAPELADEPRLARRLAWELARAGEIEAALEAIGELVEQGSADARLRLLEADLLDRSGRAADAERVLQGALTLEPPSADVALALVGLLARRGDEAAIREVLGATATRLASAGDASAADDLRLRLASRLLESGGAGGALAVLEQLQDQERGLETRLDAWLAQGEWQRVLDLVPGNGEASPGVEARRAEAHYRLGQTAEGDAAMARLLSGTDEVRLRLGVVVYQRLALHAEALPLLERLEVLAPDAIEIPFRRGASLERLGRYEEAEEVLRRLVERAPNFDQALNYLGYMLADQNTDLEDALGFIERAVELDPDNAAYRDSLGWVLYRLGRLREAKSQLELAASLAPGEPTMLDHLGDVLAALGETGPALEAWVRAIENGVENPALVRQKIEAARGGG